MKKSIFSGLLLALSLTAAAQSVNRTAGGAIVKASSSGATTEVTFYSPDIVRVVKYPAAEPEKKSLSVTMTPQNTSTSFKESNSEVSIASPSLRVTVNKASGAVRFANARGTKLFAENGAAAFTPCDREADKGSYRVRQAFSLSKDEAIYGFGIIQNGQMSQRGLHRRLMPGNTEDGIPFFQSVKGYGIFWDNYSPTQFDDDAATTASFESEVGDCVDYYFLLGGNADGVVAQMRALTGDVPMFPLWTYGFWQSRERYKTQAEVTEVVGKYRELGVPLDGIIQDWQYWGDNYLWNAMEFLSTGYPEPEKMVNDIHNMNAHIIISIWSSFGPQTKPYRELAAKNLLFGFKTWPLSGLEQWPPREDYLSGVRVYDAYNPEARDIYWNNLLRLYNCGIDGWWMDSTEPDHEQASDEDFDTPTHLGSFRRVRSAYPLMTVGGVYDHQRQQTSDRRVFILTRSGFAGQQRYGCNVWSGDVTSTWETLRKQIPAGLNFSLTGNPNFNSDLGGFFLGHYNKSWNDGTAVKNPSYQELYVRWLQFGVFTPMMRSHGTEAPREIYQFGKKGEPIYDAIESAIRLRYSLLPYVYSTSWQVTAHQASFMRALMMDFNNDKRTWNVDNEYMFGDALLVAPVVKAQYTSEVTSSADANTGWDKSEQAAGAQEASIDFTTKKTTSVYLPSGTSWYDFWTNERLSGGKTISRETTIDFIPLYVKAGSILPLGPDVQYATEKAWDNLDIRVYAGADGAFTLYEDEFDNYNYERGAYTTIPFSWDNSRRQLVIGKRSGSYNGMIASRQFRVTLVNTNGSTSTQTVSYSGSEATVAF